MNSDNYLQSNRSYDMDQFGNNNSVNNFGLSGGQMGSTSIQEAVDAKQAAEKAASTPLIEKEFAALNDAIREVGSQVDWLLKKIAPVCQPESKKVAGEKAQSNEIKASPSVLRSQLAANRELLQQISYRIASIKYTIEL